MPLRLGYNTNGFAHHRLDDAIEILADIGYRCVAITLDHYTLNPFDADWREAASRIGARLDAHDLSCVVETGARFLLDPRRKHWPTLISGDPADRQRRLDFLRRSIDVARELNAECVSFWSGANHDRLPEDRAMSHLVTGCTELAAFAAERDMPLAFEPEPGMFIDTMEEFAALRSAVADPQFGLTLDVGHVHCLNDGNPADRIREFKDILFNVHIEDMRRGTHDHLMFGAGDMEFPPIVSALESIQYTGPVNIELSRHSHDAVNAARRSFDFLTQLQA